MDSSPTALSLNLPSDLNKGKEDCHARRVFDFSLLRKETEIPKEFIWPTSLRPNALEEVKAPVVDIQGFLQGDETSTRQAAEIVRAACSTYGFFQVINHGIDPSLSHDAMSFLEEFFQLPSDAKQRIHRQPGSFWGYSGAHLDRTTSKLPWREMLSLGNSSVASENGIVDYFKSISGKDFEPMGRVYDRLFREMKELSLKMLELLAISLGLDREYFREFFEVGELNMRCISYPPCQKPEEVLGIGPHCDPSALTVLQQDQVEGFEVFLEGKWQRVCPRPEALVINIGEVFLALSNGIYKSCVHRVVVSKHSGRQTLALFLSPGDERVIQPPEALVGHGGQRRYPDFTWSELMEFVHTKSKIDTMILQKFTEWLLSSKATE